MRVSTESMIDLGFNVVVGAINFYKFPNRAMWITSFAVGLIMGTFIGLSKLSDISSVNGDETKKKTIKRVIEKLVPESVLTGTNCLALSLITRVWEESLKEGKLTHFVCGANAFFFGFHLGELFSLAKLMKSEDPDVQEFTKDVVL